MDVLNKRECSVRWGGKTRKISPETQKNPEKKKKNTTKTKQQKIRINLSQIISDIIKYKV